MQSAATPLTCMQSYRTSEYNATMKQTDKDRKAKWLINSYNPVIFSKGFFDTLYRDCFCAANFFYTIAMLCDILPSLLV